MQAGPIYYLAAAAAISLVVTLTILSAVERARLAEPPAVIELRQSQ